MTYVPKFRKTFKIDSKANLQEVAVAIDAIYKADRVATDFLGDIDPKNSSDGFRIHSLLNLLARIFEHAQAMLVAVSTGSPASAEALARIVVEGSMNVMYLATLGDSGTLIQFFRVWISEHDRKLSEWRQKIQMDKGVDEISTMIEDRRQVVTTLENFLQKVEKQCLIGQSVSEAEWPKSLFKRFEALGRETDYYESYHRLSGASHITGEDTLTWLLSQQMPIETRNKLGAEAWAYSTMMTRIASMFFIDAVAACAIAYKRLNNDDLRECKNTLAMAVNKIARKAGVPLQKTETED